MSHADSGKLEKAGEALSWLKQAELHYKWLQADIADSCIARARAALDDECFRRKPIPGFSRNQQPETLWVKNPVTNGKMLINGSDFDPNIHEVWEEPTPPATTKRSKSS